MSPISDTRVGVVELPVIAEGLRSAGFTVVDGADFRLSVHAVKAGLDAGVFPVIVADVARPGLKAWVERTAAHTRTVVVRTPAGSGDDFTNCFVLPVGATIDMVVNAAGLRTPTAGKPLAPVAGDDFPITAESATENPWADATSVQPPSQVQPAIVAPVSVPEPDATIDPWEAQKQSVVDTALAQIEAEAARIEAEQFLLEEQVVPIPVSNIRANLLEQGATSPATPEPILETIDAPRVAAVEPHLEIEEFLTPLPIQSPPVEDSWPETVVQEELPAPVEVFEAAEVLPAPMPMPAPMPAPLAPAPLPAPIPMPAPLTPAPLPAPLAAPVDGPFADEQILDDRPVQSPVQSVNPIDFAINSPVERVEAAAQPVSRPMAPSVIPGVARQAEVSTDLAPLVLVVSGRGGVGKSMLSMSLAQRAGKIGGIRTILIDANRAQGDIRVYLRLTRSQLPSVYDAALQNNPQAAIISSDRLAAERGPALEHLTFALALAPPDGMADPSVIRPDLYAGVIAAARQVADLVICDTQIIESVDQVGIVDDLVAPALRAGAWGLGISDLSAAGVHNLLDRLKTLNAAGVSRDRLLVTLNKVPHTGKYDQVRTASAFNQHGNFLGAIEADDNVIEVMNSGATVSDNPGVAPILDECLFRVTGNENFLNQKYSGGSGVVAKANSKGTAKKKRWGRRG